MIDLHVALGDYLQTRRALGTQLRGWPESFLRQFVDFLIAQESDVITTTLALRWTFLSVGLQPATYARRLGLVRAFACWLQATEPRTEIPPQRLIPAPHRRPTPYIYRQEAIAVLIAQASPLTLKKTDPVMLKIMDPQAAQLSGNFLVIVGLVDPVGEKPESVVNLWVGNCLQLSIRLSTCPEGLVHKSTGHRW